MDDMMKVLFIGMALINAPFVVALWLDRVGAKQ